MSERYESGIASFLLGALIGVAIGVMYAPAKGETTRKKLKRWASDTYEDNKEALLDHAHEIKEKVKDHWGDAREKIGEGKDKFVKEFNKRKDEVIAKFKKED